MGSLCALRQYAQPCGRFAGAKWPAKKIQENSKGLIGRAVCGSTAVHHLFARQYPKQRGGRQVPAVGKRGSRPVRRVAPLAFARCRPARRSQAARTWRKAKRWSQSQRDRRCTVRPIEARTTSNARFTARLAEARGRLSSEHASSRRAGRSQSDNRHALSNVSPSENRGKHNGTDEFESGTQANPKPHSSTNQAFSPGGAASGIA